MLRSIILLTAWFLIQNYRANQFRGTQNNQGIQTCRLSYFELYFQIFSKILRANLRNLYFILGHGTSGLSSILLSNVWHDHFYNDKHDAERLCNGYFMAKQRTSIDLLHICETIAFKFMSNLEKNCAFKTKKFIQSETKVFVLPPSQAWWHLVKITGNKKHVKFDHDI